jgi:hypothetical protein
MDNSPKAVDKFEVIDEEISIQKDNRDDENIACRIDLFKEKGKVVRGVWETWWWDVNIKIGLFGTIASR